MQQRSGRNLDELLARLPRDVAVPRALWPGIARRIARRPQRFAAFAIAASCGAICIVGALTWAAWHGGPAAGDPAAAVRRTATASPAVDFAEPQDPAYRATHAALERAFRERLAELDPGTRAKIQASLATIRSAHQELRTALAAEPENPLLEHLLQSTWRDEFDLYERVVRDTPPTETRSRS